MLSIADKQEMSPDSSVLVSFSAAVITCTNERNLRIGFLQLTVQYTVHHRGKVKAGEFGATDHTTSAVTGNR